VIGPLAKMRFLANENIEQPIVEALRRAGHDVQCVSEDAPGASDDEVMRMAAAGSRVLLTNDKDFCDLIYREGRTSSGTLLLRFKTQDGVRKAVLLLAALPEIERQLRGYFTVLGEPGARRRPLRRV